MIYVHNHSTIHRDLKPLNILLSKPNDLSGLKIIDFGIAGTNLGPHSLDESKSGTMKYMAPEILSGKDFKAQPALDVWAIGIMTYFMATGEYFWKGKTHKEFIKNLFCVPLELPMSMSKKLQKLIRAMLQLNPKDRPNLSELNSYAFFSTVYPYSQGLRLPQENFSEHSVSSEEQLDAAKLQNEGPNTEENSPKEAVQGQGGSKKRVPTVRRSQNYYSHSSIIKNRTISRSMAHNLKLIKEIFEANGVKLEKRDMEVVQKYIDRSVHDQINLQPIIGIIK